MSEDNKIDDKTLKEVIEEGLKEAEEDNSWYELYKNYTTNKSLADRD